MSRVDYRAVKSETRRNMIDGLADVLATLNSKKDIRFLLERLLTESEVVMLARRLQVAEMLVGGLTYEQIQRKLEVGTTTIRDVDGWLTDAAYEYHLIREHRRQEERVKQEARRKGRKRNIVSDFPPELQRVIRGNSRMILFRLLLGDL